MDFEEDVGGFGRGEVGLQVVEVGGEVCGCQGDCGVRDEAFILDAGEEGALVVGGGEGAEGFLEFFRGCAGSVV